MKHAIHSIARFAGCLVLGVSLAATSRTCAADAPSGETGGVKHVKAPFGVVFVKIPAGSFLMGSPPGDPMRNPDEDQVKVKLDGFWMSETEVSHRQYAAAFGHEPPDYDLVGRVPRDQFDFPVTDVSCFGMRDFLRLLTMAALNKGIFESGEAEFPTEAQWEYAARAGRKNILDEAGWKEFLRGAGENIDLGDWADRWSCGTGKPNPFGLRDMLGNVGEFCLDVYRPNLPGGTNPVVLNTPDIRTMKIVVRGASTASNFTWARYSERRAMPYGRGSKGVGFRLVWNALKKEERPGKATSDTPSPSREDKTNDVIPAGRRSLAPQPKVPLTRPDVSAGNSHCN